MVFRPVLNIYTYICVYFSRYRAVHSECVDGYSYPWAALASPCMYRRFLCFKPNAE